MPRVLCSLFTFYFIFILLLFGPAVLTAVRGWRGGGVDGWMTQLWPKKDQWPRPAFFDAPNGKRLNDWLPYCLPCMFVYLCVCMVAFHSRVSFCLWSFFLFFFSFCHSLLSPLFPFSPIENKTQHCDTATWIHKREEDESTVSSFLFPLAHFPTLYIFFDLVCIHCLYCLCCFCTHLHSLPLFRASSLLLPSVLLDLKLITSSLQDHSSIFIHSFSPSSTHFDHHLWSQNYQHLQQQPPPTYKRVNNLPRSIHRLQIPYYCVYRICLCPVHRYPLLLLSFSIVSLLWPINERLTGWTRPTTAPESLLRVVRHQTHLFNSYIFFYFFLLILMVV